MALREETHGDVTVLTPRGDMDITDLPAFEARIEALVAGGARRLLWDLSGVGLLPSTAAGFLLQAAARVRAAGGRMALAAAAPRTLATLRTMGVLEVFRVFPDRAQALAALGT